MKERIKKLYNEHKFAVGAVTGLAVMELLSHKHNNRLADKGYITCRPVGYNEEGLARVRDLSGQIYTIPK